MKAQEDRKTKIKKIYITPQLTVYGDLKSITTRSGTGNLDGVSGTKNRGT